MREKTCGCRRGVPSRLSRAQHPPKLHIPLGSCLGMVGPAPLCVTPSGPPRHPYCSSPLFSPSYFGLGLSPRALTLASPLASLPPVSAHLSVSQKPPRRSFHTLPSCVVCTGLPLPISSLPPHSLPPPHLTHAPLLPPQTGSCHQTQVPIQNA